MTVSIGKSSLARAAGLAGGTPASAGAELSAPAVREDARLESVALERIRPGKGRELSAADPALVRSVKKNGVLEPILLAQDGTGGMVLLAGANRLAAAREAGLAEIPAVIRPADGAQITRWARELERFAPAEPAGGQGTAVGEDMPTWLL